MRKILPVLCVIMLLGATAAFAAQPSGFAIGGEGSLYFAGGGGLPGSYAMLTLHFPRLPLMLGIGVTEAVAFGLTLDYWFAQGNLVSILDWYVGIGGYLAMSPTWGSAALGARLPIGLQIWPVRRVFEIFLEVAPALGVSIVPTGFDWHFQGAVGFRFWF